jgi:hypothetical protein
MAFNLGAQEMVILGGVGGMLLGWWVRPGMMITIQNIALTVAALAPLAPRTMTFEKTYEIEPLEARSLVLSAPPRQQKVTVTVTPTGGPVSAYLCKEDDHARVEQALLAGKTPPPSVVLAGRRSKDKAESYSFEATVPARTPYAVVLATGKRSAVVKVKLVGR